MLKPTWPSSLPYTDALSQSHTGTYEHTCIHGRAGELQHICKVKLSIKVQTNKQDRQADKCSKCGWKKVLSPGNAFYKLQHSLHTIWKCWQKKKHKEKKNTKLTSEWQYRIGHEITKIKRLYPLGNMEVFIKSHGNHITLCNMNTAWI